MSPDLRTKRLEDAIIAPPMVIAGRALRKFGLTTFVILKRLQNRMVVGGITTNAKGQIDFNNPENLTAILEFVYVHSAPMAEVLQTSRDPAAFADAALVHCADISLADLTDTAGEITSTIETAAAAMVEGKKTTEAEDDDPNAHGPRG